MSIEEIIHIAVREALRAELGPLERDIQEIRKALVAEGARDGYLSVREAARLASVCTNTIKKLLKDGALRRYRVGRDHRVKRSELEAYLGGAAGHEEESPSAEVIAQRILARSE